MLVANKSSGKIKVKNIRLALLGMLTSFCFRGEAQMQLADVETVIAQAATRAIQISPNSIIAVVDREGFVLGVWSMQGTPPAITIPFAVDVIDAITKAGTAAFLSSDQHAFSSRTAGFIVQQNFPPGIRNKPTGPLVGVNFSNMAFSDVNRFKIRTNYIAPTNNCMTGVLGGGGTNGAPIDLPFTTGLPLAPNGVPISVNAITGLAGSPGGVPLFKNGRLVGGVGVAGTTKGRPTGIPPLDDIQRKAAQKYDIDEDVALAAQVGYRPRSDIFGSRVFIDGIRLPYVASSTFLDPATVLPLTNGIEVEPFFLTNSPSVNYPLLTLGNVTGEMRACIIDDPMPGQIDGQDRLNAAQVRSILRLAAERARITRAGIRLPRGQPAQVFISVVNNPNKPGVTPVVLGTFRTPDATLFSWDVSVQKARTAVFFSNNQRAFSTRTVGFLAQRFYPPGITVTSPGPFWRLQEKFSLLLPGVENILNDVKFQNQSTVNRNLTNGITIFPGGFPLYRNGVLIGAIGISGDGVDQDDIIGASGTINFLPPEEIRADRFAYRGIRLPYAKFPRNPTL